MSGRPTNGQLDFE